VGSELADVNSCEGGEVESDASLSRASTFEIHEGGHESFRNCLHEIAEKGKVAQSFNDNHSSLSFGRNFRTFVLDELIPERNSQ
jgi:hypothetical protein